MGHIAGIDYGARRIGLALADARGRIASPVAALAGAGSATADADTVLAWARGREVDRFVVGLPLNMDGTDSDQTRITRLFADALRDAGRRPVELWDERLTTYQANELLAAGRIRRSRRAALRDALAAQVMLQSYLDGRRAPDSSAE